MSLSSSTSTHLIRTNPDCLNTENQYPSAKLICVVCKDSFTSPWDLMVHAQAAHMINIYEIGDSDDEKTDSENQEDNSLIELNVNGIEKNDELNGNSINQDEVSGKMFKITFTFRLVVFLENQNLRGDFVLERDRIGLLAGFMQMTDLRVETYFWGFLPQIERENSHHHFHFHS